MASNLVVQSPDFDNIRKGKGDAVEGGIKLVWYAVNELSRTSTVTAQTNKDNLSPLVLSAGPTTTQSNYDSKGATILLFTGGSAFDFTGIRNPVSGQIKILVNLGAGTMTVKHEVTSDTVNRIDMAASADMAVATNKVMILVYLNSRWREVSLA